MGHTIAHGSRVGLGQNSSWREFIPPAIKPRYFAVAIKPGGPALRWHRSTAPDSLQKPDAPAGLPRVTGSMSAVCCLQRDRRQMLHMCGFHLGLERYLALREPAMKPRSFTGTARHLRQHAQPLHRLALADIDRRAIAERLGRLRRLHHRTLNGTDLGPAMSGGFASWENLTLAAIVTLWFGLWLVA